MFSRDLRRRAIGAAACTLVYPWLFTTNWRNPVLALYDIPTLLLVGSYTGAVFSDLAENRPTGAARRGVIMLAAISIGWAAGFRYWPVSGHLTCALAAGIPEARSPHTPPLLRCLSILPALTLLVIRLYIPQSVLMGDGFNTLTGSVAGLLLGGLASRYVRRTSQEFVKNRSDCSLPR